MRLLVRDEEKVRLANPFVNVAQALLRALRQVIKVRRHSHLLHQARDHISSGIDSIQRPGRMIDASPGRHSQFSQFHRRLPAHCRRNIRPPIALNRHSRLPSAVGAHLDSAAIPILDHEGSDQPGWVWSIRSVHRRHRQMVRPRLEQARAIHHVGVREVIPCPGEVSIDPQLKLVVSGHDHPGGLDLSLAFHSQHSAEVAFAWRRGHRGIAFLEPDPLGRTEPGWRFRRGPLLLLIYGPNHSTLAKPGSARPCPTAP